MPKVGKLMMPAGEVPFGQVQTLTMDVKFELRENPDKRGDDSPDYLVKSGAVEIGGGWRHTIKKGERMGQGMISLSMDDPSFPAPLDVAAFPTDNPEVFDLVWNRKDLSKSTARADPPANNGGGASYADGPPPGHPAAA